MSKDYSQMFDDLTLMCEYAIERSDIEILKALLEDDDEAVSEFDEWKLDHQQFGVGA